MSKRGSRIARGQVVPLRLCEAARRVDPAGPVRPQDRDRAGLHLLRGLKKLNIVWTAETVSKLFEIGPMAYTPGTKMPEQKVGPEDRAALVKFLEKATK